MLSPRVEEFKKEKIKTNCSDIDELLRIRKCYGNEDMDMSFRSAKEDPKLECFKKSYLNQTTGKIFNLVNRRN